MPSQGQQMRNFLEFLHPDGWTLDMPSFTCCHCGRMVSPQPSAESQVDKETLTKAINKWMADKFATSVCRNCDALTCKYCSTECHPIERDVEKAYRDEDNQPWLLREFGKPLSRIYGPDGESILIMKDDDGRTERQISRESRPEKHMEEL